MPESDTFEEQPHPLCHEKKDVRALLSEHNYSYNTESPDDKVLTRKQVCNVKGNVQRPIRFRNRNCDSDWIVTKLVKGVSFGATSSDCEVDNKLTEVDSNEERSVKMCYSMSHVRRKPVFRGKTKLTCLATEANQSLQFWV